MFSKLRIVRIAEYNGRDDVGGGGSGSRVWDESRVAGEVTDGRMEWWGRFHWCVSGRGVWLRLSFGGSRVAYAW